MAKKLGKKRERDLKNHLHYLAYRLLQETPDDGIHTYSQCSCGRTGTRASKCWMCLVDEISATKSALPLPA